MVKCADCSIGNADSEVSEISEAPTPGVFYLNDINVAQCAGTIRVIRYCYHNSPGLPTLEARVSLYERRRFTFNRISDVFVIRNTLPPSGNTGLVCETLNLGMEVEVSEGNVFGVCIPNSNQSAVLPIFSESAGRVRTRPCDLQPPDFVGRFGLPILDDIVFHIYADTSKPVINTMIASRQLYFDFWQWL